MTEPIDHKSFLLTLSAETRATLTTRSDLSGLLHLAGHWGLIAAITGLIVAEVPYWQLLLPLQGILLIFNFTLCHECTHKTPFKSEWLNTWVGQVAGICVGLPFHWFRYFHLAHHKFTNDPKNDPELIDGEKPTTLRAYLIHISGVPTWVAQFSGLISRSLGDEPGRFTPRSALKKIQLESTFIVLLYILVGIYSLSTSTILVKIWILPVILGQPLLRLYLMAEHGKCRHVANMLENTRTVFANKVVRFVSWNMPYHIEHHTFPMVPFQNLPALNALMTDYLQVTSPSYSAFHSEYLKKLPLR